LQRASNGAIIFGDLIHARGLPRLKENRHMVPRQLTSIAALAFIGLAHMTGPVQAKRLSTVDTFLQKWDADHDGTLSLDEVKHAAIARFHMLDRHHTGTLNRWKLGATVTAWQFRRADTDKDGTLDKNEYLALVKKLFQAADKDHDGTLDRKELKSRAGGFLLRLFGPTQGPFL
jgi:hypothetical protein